MRSIPARVRVRHAPMAAGLLLIFCAPLSAAPCEEPVEHPIEVNLGTAVPVPILPNAGQLDAGVRFGAIGYIGHTVAFRDGGDVVLTIAPENAETPATVALSYAGAAPGARYAPIEMMPSTTTYLGGEAGALARLVNYGALETAELYAGVTVRHEARSRQLRTTYALAAGVDPATVRIGFTGVDGFDADPVTGILSLSPADGDAPALTLQARLNDGGRFTMVPLHADAKGVVTLELAASPAARAVETVLTFDRYFHAPAAARGPDGLVAIGRATAARAGSGADAVILGLDGDGRALRWTTILAGDGDDRASAVAVGAGGRIYLAGTTASSDLPLPGRGKRETSSFVYELASGGASLAGATSLDSRGASAPQDVLVDAAGDVLVTGRAAAPGRAGTLDFTTLLPPADPGAPAAPYFLARLDAGLAVRDVATFEGGDLGPPLELSVACGELLVGYCELPPEAEHCLPPFFESPYSISVFGVFEDGFVDTVPEGWGYHAMRWKGEFKAVPYTPAILPVIPTGLVEAGDQNDLIAAETTSIFAEDPCGPGPEWARLSADSGTALATGAAMSMDLFQTPAYTNLRIDGDDVPAAIVEVEFCVNADVGQSLRELCDMTVEDLGLGWFQVDVVDSACALQFAGDYFVDRVWVSDWAGGVYTEGRVFTGSAEFDDAYDVMETGTDQEIYIVDPPVEAPGAPAFTEEFAARFESHVFERLPVVRTVYVGGRAVAAEPATAKVRVRDLR